MCALHLRELDAKHANDASLLDLFQRCREHVVAVAASALLPRCLAVTTRGGFVELIDTGTGEIRLFLSHLGDSATTATAPIPIDAALRCFSLVPAYGCGGGGRGGRGAMPGLGGDAAGPFLAFSLAYSNELLIADLGSSSSNSIEGDGSPASSATNTAAATVLATLGSRPRTVYCDGDYILCGEGGGQVTAWRANGIDDDDDAGAIINKNIKNSSGNTGRVSPRLLWHSSVFEDAVTVLQVCRSFVVCGSADYQCKVISVASGAAVARVAREPEPLIAVLPLSLTAMTAVGSALALCCAARLSVYAASPSSSSSPSSSQSPSWVQCSHPVTLDVDIQCVTSSCNSGGDHVAAGTASGVVLLFRCTRDGGGGDSVSPRLEEVMRIDVGHGVAGLQLYPAATNSQAAEVEEEEDGEVLVVVTAAGDVWKWPLATLLDGGNDAYDEEDGAIATAAVDGEGEEEEEDDEVEPRPSGRTPLPTTATATTTATSPRPPAVDCTAVPDDDDDGGPRGVRHHNHDDHPSMPGRDPSADTAAPSDRSDGNSNDHDNDDCSSNIGIGGVDGSSRPQFGTTAAPFAHGTADGSHNSHGNEEGYDDNSNKDNHHHDVPYDDDSATATAAAATSAGADSDRFTAAFTAAHKLADAFFDSGGGGDDTDSAAGSGATVTQGTMPPGNSNSNTNGEGVAVGSSSSSSGGGTSAPPTAASSSVAPHAIPLDVQPGMDAFHASQHAAVVHALGGGGGGGGGTAASPSSPPPPPPLSSFEGLRHGRRMDRRKVIQILQSELIDNSDIINIDHSDEHDNDNTSVDGDDQGATASAAAAVDLRLVAPTPVAHLHSTALLLERKAALEGVIFDYEGYARDNPLEAAAAEVRHPIRAVHYTRDDRVFSAVAAALSDNNNANSNRIEAGPSNSGNGDNGGGGVMGIVDGGGGGLVAATTPSTSAAVEDDLMPVTHGRRAPSWQRRLDPQYAAERGRTGPVLSEHFCDDLLFAAPDASGTVLFREFQMRPVSPRPLMLPMPMPPTPSVFSRA